jgi:CRP-like cAMP-binding protein
MARLQMFSLRLTGNHLLDRLPLAEYRQLLPDLEPVALTFQQVLYEPGETIRRVYFPTQAVVCLLAVMGDGTCVEVASVGGEGVVGLRALLGAESMPQRAMVQFPGQALRLRADALKGWASRGGPLAHLLPRYIGSFLTQVAQVAACNALHPLGQRFCRWLLMARDRVGSDEFPVTHEFLARMLGVDRPRVTEAAGPLQEEGLIRCGRGKVVILDRQGLVEASCGCYRVIRDEYARLFG